MCYGLEEFSEHVIFLKIKKNEKFLPFLNLYIYSNSISSFFCSNQRKLIYCLSFVVFTHVILLYISEKYIYINIRIIAYTIIELYRKMYSYVLNYK